MSDCSADSPSTGVKKNYLLTGTNPPQWLSADQVADVAKQVNYQPRRLARELGLTGRTLGRHFNRAFGCGPREWLKQRRMSDGVTLLGRGFNTKQVASELGFQDRSSLFRVFRRQLQPTPRRLADRVELPIMLSGSRPVLTLG